jgi:hypothetical protein
LGQRCIINPSFWQSFRQSAGPAAGPPGGRHSAKTPANPQLRKQSYAFPFGWADEYYFGSVLFIRILFRIKHYVAVFSIETLNIFHSNIKKTLRTFSLQHYERHYERHYEILRKLREKRLQLFLNILQLFS